MGEMRVLTAKGDETLTWDPNDQEQVGKARETFDKLKEKGFEFYEVAETKGKRVEKFSPKLGRLIAAPGGRKETDKRAGNRPLALSGGPVYARR